ncbi:hypothetical protein CAOG_03605 [Capsaspora owczarzaki ATCC 30864]|uniref:Uncharacterized protein n=1 Tax=Capsaspora owczarzaki (strain ATCC 30864) TaxID=595528 RepID=A0A0D2X2J9_CAPO3|nr:hypothetical protein CAOG_03605 [Capsaspora owczarzaki ATCC 30864]KJE92689.1 hypothetical protein CAOG_003605 [Capsaspora owczarzaki ATCC 30864]|eukprot:XP_004363333.2 hypothetical protein CAOG_03605 [Capsaspora owczarzaki ATCC 30864]
MVKSISASALSSSSGPQQQQQPRSLFRPLDQHVDSRFQHKRQQSTNTTNIASGSSSRSTRPPNALPLLSGNTTPKSAVDLAPPRPPPVQGRVVETDVSSAAAPQPPRPTKTASRHKFMPVLRQRSSAEHREGFDLTRSASSGSNGSADATTSAPSANSSKTNSGLAAAASANVEARALSRAGSRSLSNSESLSGAPPNLRASSNSADARAASKQSLSSSSAPARAASALHQAKIDAFLTPKAPKPPSRGPKMRQSLIDDFRKALSCPAPSHPREETVTRQPTLVPSSRPQKSLSLSRRKSTAGEDSLGQPQATTAATPSSPAEQLDNISQPLDMSSQEREVAAAAPIRQRRTVSERDFTASSIDAEQHSRKRFRQASVVSLSSSGPTGPPSEDVVVVSNSPKSPRRLPSISRHGRNRSATTASNSLIVFSDSASADLAAGGEDAAQPLVHLSQSSAFSEALDLYSPPDASTTAVVTASTTVVSTRPISRQQTFELSDPNVLPFVQQQQQQQQRNSSVSSAQPRMHSPDLFQDARPAGPAHGLKREPSSASSSERRPILPTALKSAAAHAPAVGLQPAPIVADAIFPRPAIPEHYVEYQEEPASWVDACSFDMSRFPQFREVAAATNTNTLVSNKRGGGLSDGQADSAKRHKKRREKKRRQPSAMFANDDGSLPPQSDPSVEDSNDSFASSQHASEHSLANATPRRFIVRNALPSRSSTSHAHDHSSNSSLTDQLNVLMGGEASHNVTRAAVLSQAIPRLSSSIAARPPDDYSQQRNPEPVAYSYASIHAWQPSMDNGGLNFQDHSAHPASQAPAAARDASPDPENDALQSPHAAPVASQDSAIEPSLLAPAPDDRSVLDHTSLNSLPAGSVNWTATGAGIPQTLMLFDEQIVSQPDPDDAFVCHDPHQTARPKVKSGLPLLSSRISSSPTKRARRSSPSSHSSSHIDIPSSPPELPPSQFSAFGSLVDDL